VKSPAGVADDQAASLNFPSMLIAADVRAARITFTATAAAGAAGVPPG
jgi:hypothetical protein